jgi:hypothetical protein
MAQLSENAKKQLEKNKEWRSEMSESSQYVKIQPGTSKTLLFDTDDMNIETVEFDKAKGPVKRAKYGVYDITQRLTTKQWFTGGKNVSNAIDSNLEEGNIVLKITRSGEGFDTKYTVVATQLPSDYQSPL